MKISEYPQVATVAPGDDFIINQEVGGGEYVTRRGSFQALINGLVTRDLTWSGEHTFESGVTLSGLTANRALFTGAGGLLEVDSALRWNNTSKRLGIGLADQPEFELDVLGQVMFGAGTDGQLRLRNSGATTPAEWWWQIRNAGMLQLRRNFPNPHSFILEFAPATGNIGLSTTAPNFLLDSNGDARIRSNNRLRFGGTGAADTRGSIFAPEANTLAFHTGSGAGAEALKLEPAVTTVSTDLTVNGAVVMMPNLPTENPNVAGQLWNDGGTLKISAGP